MRTDATFLNTMRRSGDPEADNIIAQLADTQSVNLLYTYLPLNREQVKKHRVSTLVQQFLLMPTRIPAWADPHRLKRGQSFFRKYALDIMTLLGAMSLPYCYAASPGNKAIYLTEKMRKSPGKRLLETAHFIIEVMKEGSFEVEGSGAFEVQKTRLIHALVRHFIQQKTPWDQQWGVPVNQEDMAGTNLAFSFIIIQGMEQSEFQLSPDETEDFLYAWRFIGYQLHIDEELLPSTREEAAILERAIRERHFRESAEGPLLANELIAHYRESFPAVASYFIDSQIRYFIGPEVSQLLGLKAQPVKDRFVRAMNSLRKRINKNFVNPFSYRIMLRNHFKLKERYKEGAV